MTVYAELDPNAPDKIIIRAPYLKKDLIKSLPGSSFGRDNLWRIPLSWPSCLALRYTFRDELDIGEELAAWAANLRETRIDPALEQRDVIDSSTIVADDLYPHQRGDVNFLRAAERAILCNGLGSGKSRSAFATVRELAKDGHNPFPVLISCPNSTKYGWEREVSAIWPGLVVQVINGTAVQRRKQLKTPAHVYIINHEAVRGHSRLAPFGSIALKRCSECGGANEAVRETACEVHLRELNNIDFGTVIVDEAHRIKDPSSKISRAIKAATGTAPYRFALTGTPIANAPDDIYSILNWLYPEAYPSKTKFIDRFVEMSYNAWGGSQAIGLKRSAEEEFFKGVDPILRRMPNEIILPFLPPVIKERRDVDMVPKQAKAYKQMAEQMIAELDAGEKMVTLSPLTKMTRLLQLSSAYAEIEWVDVEDEETGVVSRKANITLSEPSGMLDAFMEDIPDFGDNSVIVFSPSKQLLQLLAARMDKANIAYRTITGDDNTYDRQESIDLFQAGRVKFILVTTAAGGAGITLTKAKIACWLGRPWSNIDSEQSEGRNRRIGSEIHDSIIHRDYVPRGTVHEVVFDALEQKNNNLQSILRDKDLMKKIIEDTIK